jgi:hypothetical protein
MTTKCVSAACHAASALGPGCISIRMPITDRARTDSGRLTLIEAILFPLYILLIVSCVQWGLHRHGWRGAVLGLLFVFIILPLGAIALGLLLSAVYSGMPSYPACRTGKCHSSNYRLRRLENGRPALFCACGAPYRKRGRRFYEVQPDGSLRPYMVWRAFRGWFPDA